MGMGAVSKLGFSVQAVSLFFLKKMIQVVSQWRYCFYLVAMSSNYPKWHQTNVYSLHPSNTRNPIIQNLSTETRHHSRSNFKAIIHLIVLEVGMIILADWRTG